MGRGVSFFLGNSRNRAKLNSTFAYDRGPIKLAPERSLTLGNFVSQEPARNDTGDSSRILRGLASRIRFFDKALTLDEIACQQLQ